MTEELKPRIVVFGVGGAGGNAVDNMIEANLQGVEFVVANTDSQALLRSKTDKRIQLGPETTGGLGAGARPDIGAAAAEESREEIAKALEGAHMVFVAAGMGGGTGTGAAPVIAQVAQDKGILTVAVVTKPFGFEGNRRMRMAEDGLKEMASAVDTMIVVPNQNLFRIANERTTFADAFRMADDVLYSGVRGITDLMVMPGLINLDFADVRSIMHGMGTAMMGMGEAEGENRALDAARQAIDNPLLDDVTMKGARGVLINITGGYDMTLFELDEAANEIRAEVDPDANIILGSTFDPEMEGKVRVSVVAAGLESALGLARLDGPVAAPSQPETPVSMDERPVVVTSAGTMLVEQAEPVSEEDELFENQADPRPDFAGRELPAAHVPGAEGADEVSADAVLGRAPTGPVAPPPSQPNGPSQPGKSEGSQAGFSNLFGWRADKSDNDDAPAAQMDGALVSTTDDHPEPAPFDDEDLEIPAFLRRSANH
ncbi:MAG: cell division protein FtsZ [Hyphomonadaceae bacterium]|nr:cell division protein FtsZ [Hyphomonadaceae bacterium]